MASMRRTIVRAITCNPKTWRLVAYNHGENRNERRRRAHAPKKEK